MKKITVTEKIKVKRLPKRGVYDFATIAKILDDSFVCHIGFVIDEEDTHFLTSYEIRNP